MKKPIKLTSCPKGLENLDSRYEKSTVPKYRLNSHHNKQSPAHSKAKAVLKKYKKQLRQREFRKLQNLVPSIQNRQEEPSEVSPDLTSFSAPLGDFSGVSRVPKQK